MLTVDTAFTAQQRHTSEYQACFCGCFVVANSTFPPTSTCYSLVVFAQVGPNADMVKVTPKKVEITPGESLATWIIIYLLMLLVVVLLLLLLFHLFASVAVFACCESIFFLVVPPYDVLPSS